MAKESDASARKQLKKMEKTNNNNAKNVNNNKSNERIVNRNERECLPTTLMTLDGMMAYGRLEDGRKTADFVNFEETQMEPVVGKFHVQLMRDGNMYMTQEKPRVRQKPVLKLAHSSVSFGKDGFDRYVFTLPSEQRSEFCQLLHDEAREAGLFIDINY
jgi:hypothetical protein